MMTTIIVWHYQLVVVAIYGADNDDGVEMVNEVAIDAGA
jgi:hypothetical protein